LGWLVGLVGIVKVGWGSSSGRRLRRGAAQVRCCALQGGNIAGILHHHLSTPHTFYTSSTPLSHSNPLHPPDHHHHHHNNHHPHHHHHRNRNRQQLQRQQGDLQAQVDGKRRQVEAAKGSYARVVDQMGEVRAVGWAAAGSGFRVGGCCVDGVVVVLRGLTAAAAAAAGDGGHHQQQWWWWCWWWRWLKRGSVAARPRGFAVTRGWLETTRLVADVHVCWRSTRIVLISFVVVLNLRNRQTPPHNRCTR